MPAKTKAKAKKTSAPKPMDAPVGGPFGGKPNAHGVNVERPEPPHTNVSHSPKKGAK